MYLGLIVMERLVLVFLCDILNDESSLWKTERFALVALEQLP